LGEEKVPGKGEGETSALGGVLVRTSPDSRKKPWYYKYLEGLFIVGKYLDQIEGRRECVGERRGRFGPSGGGRNQRFRGSL